MATTRSTFKKWYEKNKGDLSLKRQRRYDTDPEYRERVKERQRAYHERNKKVREPKLKKVVINGKEVVVHRIGYAADVIGCSDQVIRHWERDNLIPRSSIPGDHRYYTEHQISLLNDLYRVVIDQRYKRETRASAIAEQSKLTIDNWELLND